MRISCEYVVNWTPWWDHGGLELKVQSRLPFAFKNQTASCCGDVATRLRHPTARQIHSFAAASILSTPARHTPPSKSGRPSSGASVERSQQYRNKRPNEGRSGAPFKFCGTDRSESREREHRAGGKKVTKRMFKCNHSAAPPSSDRSPPPVPPTDHTPSPQGAQRWLESTRFAGVLEADRNS
jgi:hypothetical protein